MEGQEDAPDWCAAASGMGTAARAQPVGASGVPSASYAGSATWSFNKQGLVCVPTSCQEGGDWLMFLWPAAGKTGTLLGI